MQEILNALDDEMTGVQEVCAVVSEVVATTFFAAADPTAWITEGTRWMRLNIVHKTGFRYASPVRASYNEARMTPSVNDHPDRVEQPAEHRAGRLEHHLHRLLGHRGDHLRGARAALAG